MGMKSTDLKLTLYRGWPDRGTYAGSPFATKVEFRLRHAKLPYNVDAGSARAAPKGKIPYADLSALLPDDGSEIPSLMGDSTLILRRLLSMGKIADLNHDLTEEQRLDDLAIRALLEDKLYFYNVSGGFGNEVPQAQR